MNPWVHALAYMGLTMAVIMGIAVLSFLAVKLSDRFGDEGMVAAIIAAALLFMGVVGYFTA